MNNLFLIDDQPADIAFLKSNLSAENFSIEVSNNPIIALQQISQNRPDLILINLGFKKESGIELCQKLFFNETSSEIPIIFITSKLSGEEIKFAFEAGAVDVIRMPVSRAELTARIASALNLREMQKLLIEAEKIHTFTATVVTTNHKIKQPLTLINLALTAIKRELKKDELSREAIIQKAAYIEEAVKEIKDILDQLNSISKPTISNYLLDIKMIDLDSSDKNKKIK